MALADGERHRVFVPLQVPFACNVMRVGNARQREGGPVDLRVLGIILGVMGAVALIVSLTKGPNLGISRGVGIAISVVILVVGVGLFISSVAS